MEDPFERFIKPPLPPAPAVGKEKEEFVAPPPVNPDPVLEKVPVPKLGVLLDMRLLKVFAPPLGVTGFVIMKPPGFAVLENPPPLMKPPPVEVEVFGAVEGMLKKLFVGAEAPPPNEGTPDVPPPNEGAPVVPEDIPPPNEDTLEVPNEGVPDITPPNEGTPLVPEEIPPNEGIPDVVPPPNEDPPEVPTPNEGPLEAPPPNEGTLEVLPPNEGTPLAPPPKDGSPELPPPKVGAPVVPLPNKGAPVGLLVPKKDPPIPALV